MTTVDNSLSFSSQRITLPLTRRTITATLAMLIVLGNAAVIVVLWASGGNLQVHSTGALLDSIGRITGLLGAYLLLLQVVLLSRIPPLERVVGFDRLTRWHRLNGKVTIVLILAHVAAITAGYAQTDRLSLTAEAQALVTQYPGMVAATAGTLLLIATVFTSLYIVRRRLRYEAWYLVHLTAYAGIVLSWPHEIPTGNELVLNKPAAAYWTALYLVTLGLLIVFRFAAPAVLSTLQGYRVAEVIQEAPGIVSLRITGRRLDLLGARAGQFFLWRFLDKGRWWESHPFSLSAVPDRRGLRLTVKSSGDFTAKLDRIAPGTRVVAEGPLGTFTAEARRRDRVLMVAGGIGITPLRALLEEMHGDRILLYRVMHEAEIVFRGELDALARDEDVTVHYLVGDHRTPEGQAILSPENIRRLVPDLPDRDVYLCGPPVMMDVTEAALRAAGATRILSEKFALSAGKDPS